MTDTPWQGDACSLVDAFRAGERSPVEELEATLAAIEASDLNCFTYVDPERARETADAGRRVAALRRRARPPSRSSTRWRAGRTPRRRSCSRTAWRRTRAHQTQRLFERGGVVPVGQTTASEFGGLNVSVTKINGVTHNPWQHGRTVGGSSGGSAAAVAGGLVSLATGGDGGGSIRIPAGYTGLLGMKGTFGRIPRSPHAYMRPHTVVLGNLSRSVRDAARFYDVCAGVHPYDPTSLPSPGGWEAGLGTQDLRGLRVAVVPEPRRRRRSSPAWRTASARRPRRSSPTTGMVEVDLRVEPPNLAAQWTMGNLATLLADLGDKWPACSDDLTDEMAVGLHLAEAHVQPPHRGGRRGAARPGQRGDGPRPSSRSTSIIAATNPGPAFPAEWVDQPEAGPGRSTKLFGAGRARYVVLRGLLGSVRLVAGAVPKLPSAMLSIGRRRSCPTS